MISRALRAKDCRSESTSVVPPFFYHSYALAGARMLRQIKGLQRRETGDSIGQWMRRGLRGRLAGSSRATTNEEPRHVFRGAGLTILRLMPSYAGLIYEALPRCMREFDVWVRLD